MLLLNIILVIIKIIDADCPFKLTRNNQTVTITNFNNLSQLTFNHCKEPIIVYNWQLKPDKKLILDNRLNFKGLTIITKNKYLNCIVNLINFKGFDLLSNPFKDINFIGYLSLKHVIWLIEQSNFEFYLNTKLINNKKDCNNSNNWDNLITNSKLYFLMISNSQYSIKTCPYIFKNSQIKSLFLKEIKSSFIGTNILTFSKTNDLESFVLQVDFDLYRIYFDDNLFDKMVFRNTKILDINGILIGIQNDLFKSFNEMKLIRIRSQHVKQIFAKNNKWFEYLNFYFRPIDPNSLIEPAFLKQLILLIIYQTFPRVTFYDYPNEDFCLFSKFPHNKLVFPQLRPNHDSNCSCTQLYLIQYSFRIKFAVDFYSDQVSMDYRMPQYYTDEIKDKNFSICIKNKQDLKDLVEKCEFKQRLEKCSILIPLISIGNDSYFEMYDWLEARKMSNLIFTVYLNSIFSLIIIILNILTLKILKTKSIVNEKNPMYNFLFINTILCLIYITICLFKVIGICVDYEFYCSPLIETKFNVYYKTIFVLFIGETIKTASNFSFISFSLSRYIKVTSTKSRLLLKLDKLKKRYYFLNSLIIAIFINLYHLFEYDFNLAKLPEIFNGGLKSIEIFFKYSNPSDEFIEHFSSFQYYILNIFFYLKIIFSDLFYIILNLIIDLRLLSFIKIQNSKKITIIRLITANTANNKAISTTNRLTVMIILNGLNCFLLRFPSAFASFYGFIFRFDIADKIFKPNIPSYIVCRGFKICPSLQEILYFLYLISLFLQFFIFLKFDKIFRKGFNEIKTNFFKKIRILTA
jgi:hypothetical protein